MIAQYLVSTYASYVRIDKYLQEEEVPNWVSWQSEARTQSYDPKSPFDERVGIQDGVFRWVSPNEKEEAKPSKPSVASRLRSVFKRVSKVDDVAKAVDVDEQDTPEEFELKNINVFFKRGHLNLVSGPTGSGKSSRMFLAYLSTLFPHACPSAFRVVG